MGVRPTMGKHARPPMGKNHKERGPKGSEHFEGKNDEQDDQEEHGHGMRPPMGKNQREEGPEGSEHFEGKNDEQDDKDDQEEHGFGIRFPMPSMEEQDRPKLNQQENSFWKHLDEDNKGEQKEEIHFKVKK